MIWIIYTRRRENGAKKFLSRSYQDRENVKRSEAQKPLHIWESICRFSFDGEICGSKTKKKIKGETEEYEYREGTFFTSVVLPALLLRAVTQ